MVNKIVTLNVKTKKGVRHLRFEFLKDLGNNKYLLINKSKIFVGEKVSWGLWNISELADIKNKPIIQQECGELHTKELTEN